MVTPGVSVTYTSSSLDPAATNRTVGMTPQDQDLIFAKVDAKMADLRGDVRLNTQGLADLKERFSTLAGAMASVPADIASMKTSISHLPTKDELGKKLLAYIGTGVAVVGVMIALATFILRAAAIGASSGG